MTHDPLSLFSAAATYSLDYRFSLWTRRDNAPDHWRLEMIHRRERCDEMAAILADPPPDNGLLPWEDGYHDAPKYQQDDPVETLVLPPHETPSHRPA